MKAKTMRTLGGKAIRFIPSVTATVLTVTILSGVCPVSAGSNSISRLGDASAALESAGAIPENGTSIDPPTPPDPDGFNLGATYYNNGDFDSAITYFTKILKDRPLFTDALFARGNCYEAKKQYKDAIADFSVVIERKPNLYDAYVERGRSYSSIGKFKDAKSDLEKAISLKLERSDAYQVLGDAYFNQKDYEKAVTAYSTFISIEPKPEAIIYQNRGEANYSAKHYDAAIADFEKIPDKEAADTKIFLGDCYMALKKYPDAIKAYTAYIDTHPNDTTGAALNSRALAELQNGDYKEAVADYQAYLKLRPDEAVKRNGPCFGPSPSSGKVPLSELEEAIKTDPTNIAVRIQLAKGLFEEKQYTKAITQYDQILAAKPDDYEDLLNRGLAEANSGDHAKALADFSAYTKAKPNDALGWSSLGLEYEKDQNWWEVVVAFSQDIDLKPDDLEGYKKRGIAEYGLHNYKAAVEDLRRFDDAKPGDATVTTILRYAVNVPDDVSGDIAATKAQCEKHPEDVSSWYSLGFVYRACWKLAPATDAFTHALALKKHEILFYSRGLAYYKLGETDPAAYAKAIADATAALDLKPDYTEARLLKADAEYEEKKYKDARADYTAYLAIPTITLDNKTSAQRQLLRIAIDENDYDSAITRTTEWIDATPSDASNYQLRGAIYVAQKKYDLAILDLTKYTTMKPDEAYGFYDLGVAYAGKKDNANAAAAFEKALSIRTTDFDAANHAALAYKALADADASDAAKCGPEYDKAIALFDKAATIKGSGKDAADALFNEASALEAKAKNTNTTDSLKVAITVWTRYPAVAPNDPDIDKVKAHVDALKKQFADK